MLTARHVTPERMDDPNVDPAALDRSLRFIRLINRRLGGTAAALRYFKKWARERGGWKVGETIRILDVGTGSADIPLAIAAWAKRRGHRVHITAIDLHPATLALARAHVERVGVGGREDITLEQLNALSLTDRFAPESFHHAHAGMFLHHLSDIEVMTVLRMMDRLTTRGIIWNDLVRGWVGRLGARLLTLGTPAMVRHDALVSVEAGFTRREALDLATRAGITNPRYRRHLFHRFTLTSHKR